MSRLQDLLPFSSLHGGLLLELHESEAAVSGQGSWKVPVCLRKCRHLGPPATCLLPKGRIVTCKQRPGGQESGGDTAILLPHPFLSEESLRRNPRQAAVLLPGEKDSFSLCIHQLFWSVGVWQSQGSGSPKQLGQYYRTDFTASKEGKAMEGWPGEGLRGCVVIRRMGN